MATSLLDKLKNQLGQGQQAQFKDEGGRAQQLLRSRTGKAGAQPSGPRASSVAERMAVAGTQQQLDQQEQVGDIAAERLGVQEQAQAEQEGRAMEGALLSQEAVQQSLQQRGDELLGQFERGMKQLDMSKHESEIEQLGHILRLDNKKYVDDLQQVAQRQRLDNDYNFRTALQEDVFSDMGELLKKDLAFKEMMAMDDAEFAREIADMDIGFAMEIAKEQDEMAKSQAIFSGLGTAVSAGAQAYAASEADKDKG